ncbi:MAG: methyl-accepting chemotaxis protein [Sulfitobacter sp.]
MTFATTPTALNITEHASPQALRCAIDLVATLRARMIRVGLFGTFLYRPDPAVPSDPAQRIRELDILTDEVETITRVCATLTRGSPLPDTPQIIADWIALTAAQMPDILAKIVQMDGLSRNVLTAAQSGSSQQRSALAEHMRVARDGFFDAVTTLCDALWDDIYAQHSLALEQATEAALSLGDRLTRLDRIGKHVRLVSLNASVEAARAGDVGKGLMVIAHEFKSLAEEIQTLAKAARGDMDRIS